jgi:hypothetical protein
MIRHLMKMIKGIKKIYPATSFKVVGVSGDPQNKNTYITYQVSGKSTVITEKPILLLKELMSVRGFSKQDEDLIYNLAVSEMLSHSFRILSIQFEEGSVKFEIEDIHSKYVFLLTAAEIVGSSNLLENFSSRDLIKIYFQLVKENMQQQKILKNQLLQISKYETIKNIYFLKIFGVNE